MASESHIGTIGDAKRLINELDWNITWGEKNDVWKVWAGDRVILRTDSKEVCDAFIYGMSLAYSIVPQKFVDQIRKEYGESEE